MQKHKTIDNLLLDLNLKPDEVNALAVGVLVILLNEASLINNKNFVARPHMHSLTLTGQYLDKKQGHR